jgi:hypothetical protein
MKRSKPEIQLVLRIGIAIFLMVFPVRLFASEGILFECPDEVVIGKPFRVAVTSRRELDDLRITWSGIELNPEIVKQEDGSFTTEVILGTDVSRNNIGYELIKLYLVSGKDTTAFSWQVRIAPFDYPSESFTVSSAMVKPPASVTARINRERKLITRALGSDSTKKFWELPFALPLGGEVTSSYGKNRILNGTKHYRHNGVDLRAGTGTPVKAVAAGRVVLAEDLYFGGRSVYVHHGNGLVSIYCHLSEISVEDGAFLHKGELLGLSGSSGRVTGPHLHLGMSIKGQMMDPMTLFSGNFGDEKDNLLQVF